MLGNGSEGSVQSACGNSDRQKETKTMMMKMMGMILVVVMLGPAFDICFEGRAEGQVG